MELDAVGHWDRQGHASSQTATRSDVVFGEQRHRYWTVGAFPHCSDTRVASDLPIPVEDVDTLVRAAAVSVGECVRFRARAGQFVGFEDGQDRAVGLEQ